MNFNSFGFFIFLLITFTLYYLPFLKRFQLLTVVAASFYFYAYTDPWLLILLLFSIFWNASIVYLIQTPDFRSKKAVLALGVVLNLSVLFFFKYSGLFAKTFLGNSGSSELHWIFLIPLPIGISFYTFHGISMVVDFYRIGTEIFKEKVPYPKLVLQSSLYINFFPQLVAGPIVKAKEFFPQIKTKDFKDIPWIAAAKILILGYFLKTVIADNLNDLTFVIDFPYNAHHSTLTLILLIFGYSAQIFSDFAGYSLIAIGTAFLFGYRLPTNFNFPYISSNFSEFWRRWHISLSTWLRDYLYIPLGGNRKGNFRTYINLFLVMALGGLWHGAEWRYMVWGIGHGLLLLIERFLDQNLPFKLPENRFFSFIKAGFVFLCVSLLWLLFRLPDFETAVKYLKLLGTNLSLGTDWELCTFLIFFSIPVFFYHVYGWYKEKYPEETVEKVSNIGYAFLLFMIVLNKGPSAAFIYFQF
ncbi:MBOAT family O-acyltransferase [Leptospira andrefontaineae]|uniref:MBOAT family protein n=1 Tax=Leptospira andrefontaineae TaxID=2484976 RepID=A0A4R9GW28_9LEPT|nr:MBOAT family O-acyltransferase [Leptospira andrefontaineae]TGK35371.1 MBOAT family protein [Leptospira andrefontaineae]